MWHSAAEDLALLDAVKAARGERGGRRELKWAAVALSMPGRTDNACKRRHTQLSKGLPLGAQGYDSSVPAWTPGDFCHRRLCVSARLKALEKLRMRIRETDEKLQDSQIQVHQDLDLFILELGGLGSVCLAVLHRSP
jgi:Myb-like DNA-binding domain